MIKAALKPAGKKTKVMAPPKALLCRCVKCDNKWTVRMQLIQDTTTPPMIKPKKKRSRNRPKPKLYWAFDNSEFESCHECNNFEIQTTVVAVDENGYIKLHIAHNRRIN